jgi:translation elongation factor EF-Tu-like GTPase
MKQLFVLGKGLKSSGALIAGFFYICFAAQNPAYAADSDLKVSALDGPMPRFRLAVEAARNRGDTQIVVQIEDISIRDDPEILELVKLETRELLLNNNFDDESVTIIECPRKCDAPPDPPEPVDDGTTVTLQVSALDGPMPPFLVALDQAKDDNIYRVIVHLENVGSTSDSEIIELIKLEINQILEKYSFTQNRRAIIQCSSHC